METFSRLRNWSGGESRPSARLGWTHRPLRSQGVTPAAPSPLSGSPSPQGPHEVGRYASPTVMVRSGAVGVLLADSGSPSFPPGEAALRGERPWSALRGSAACRGRWEAGLEAGVEAGGAEWRPLGCPAAGEATRGPKQGSAGAGQRLRVFPHEGQNRCSQFPVLQGISNHFGLSGGREEAGRAGSAESE